MARTSATLEVEDDGDDVVGCRVGAGAGELWTPMGFSELS